MYNVKIKGGVTFGPQRGRGGYKGSRGDLLNRIWLKGGGGGGGFLREGSRVGVQRLRGVIPPLPLWTRMSLPHVKFNQLFTRPCLDSSQFLANSFSLFFFSSAANSNSRFLAASSDALLSNCFLLLSRSANNFMVKM